MSPDPILPGPFLPCSLPQLLTAAAGGGLEPSPARRFRGASPHRLLSYANESPVADSFAHGTLRTPASNRTAEPSGRSLSQSGRMSSVPTGYRALPKSDDSA